MRFQVSDVTTYPLALNTLGKHITAGYELHATCEKCLHHGRLNLVQLAYRIGFDHKCMRDDIRPHVRCRECGAKQMGFIVSPPSQCSEVRDAR